MCLLSVGASHPRNRLRGMEWSLHIFACCENHLFGAARREGGELQAELKNRDFCRDTRKSRKSTLYSAGGPPSEGGGPRVFRGPQGRPLRGPPGGGGGGRGGPPPLPRILGPNSSLGGEGAPPLRKRVFRAYASYAPLRIPTPMSGEKLYRFSTPLLSGEERAAAFWARAVNDFSRV